jgi:N utilization substance protein B
LQTALEEMELVLDQNYWTQEIDIILSYVVKTIKRFKQTNGDDQPLLQMFDSEEEVNFAKDLLRLSIEKHEEYNELVVSHLKNWDADRIAYMDKIILQTALTEILNFPDIALEVSLNEYLEIAKEYSSEKSHIFINGILDEILRKYKQENNLLKAMMLRG